MTWLQVMTPRVLADFAIAYQPDNLIADNLMTEIPVSLPAGTFRSRTKASMLTTVDARVGEVGIPAELRPGYGSGSFVTDDFALKEPISNKSLKVADPSINLEQDAVMQVKIALQLIKEVDAAGKLTNSANYAAGQSTALSGTAQWSDYTNSDPIVAIDTSRPKVWRSPSAKLVAWCGTDVWTILKNHPKVLGRIIGGANANVPGHMLRKMFAELIEVDEFYVGDARTASAFARVWGKNFGIAAVEQSQNPDWLGLMGRFVYQKPQVFMWQDIEPGLQGAKVVKISESYQQQVAANDAGYLWNTAVA